MAAQYQVGDRVSSTEYNPSYFSRKTKELFTPGQGPALAARAAGPVHTSPPAWPQQTPLLERLGPTQSPGKVVNREGEPALGWTSLGMAAAAASGWLDPAGKAMVVPAHGLLPARRKLEEQG